MSIQDYLHEKAEESRHNEIIAYMMFLAGSVFFVGGILSSLGMGREPNWFLFIPYLADSTQVLFLEIALLLTGLLLIFSGIGVARAREQRIQIARPISASKTRTISSKRKRSSE